MQNRGSLFALRVVASEFFNFCLVEHVSLYQIVAVIPDRDCVPASIGVVLTARIIHTFSVFAGAILLSTSLRALDWKGSDSVRCAELSLPSVGKAGFELLPGSLTGITFSNNVSKQRVWENRILDNGSGVALGDVDGDGLCDIYFCRLEGPNVLYRNLGDWKFKEVTDSAGVACAGQWSTGAVFADLDGDTDLDLLVNGIGTGTRFFVNDGNARFAEKRDAGFQRRFGSTSMALADIDGDGDLDVYVTNYRTDTMRDSQPGLKIEIFEKNGQIIARPEDRFLAVRKSGGVQVIERGEPDFLYLNDGGGRFRPVSWTSGTFRDVSGQSLTGPPRDWGLSAVLRDFTGDGAPDLFVCNDFMASFDQIWINDGMGRFQSAAPLAFRHASMSSMGADFADINRDGHVDLIVVDMLSREHERRLRQRENVHPEMLLQQPGWIENRPEVMRNTLFLNRGDGTFAEIAPLSGLDATEWSWCPAFLDVDLDGYEDLLVTTGNGHDVLDSDDNARLKELGRVRGASNPPQALAQMGRLDTPNLAFRNRGDLTFSEVGKAWGFHATGVSHGMALADLDNDGDLDVVVNNLNALAGIYRNQSTAARVAVRLKGNRQNVQGIGARIRVTGGPVPQSQEIVSGGRYLSGDDPIRVFAAGHASNSLHIEVDWRGGRRSVVDNVRANHFYEIREPDRTEELVDRRSSEDRAGIQTAKMFTAIDIGHTHHEEAFDDFARQPLLAHRLSQLGPGVAWQDVDSDGWDDLVVGTGRGGQLAVYRNNSRGGFEKFHRPFLNRPAARDQTAVVGFGNYLFVGSSNYEDGSTNGGAIRIYDLNRQVAGESILGRLSSTGPIALADVEADGDLDLFVGGRSLPGRYPEAADSILMRNEGGRFVPWQEFSKIGLVSGALFTDLNDDGSPELVLACHWGPLRVFERRDERFVDVTSECGLSEYSGFWNGIAAGDFDGDGRMDLVASNLGRNSKFERFRRTPLRVYYGDFDRNGTVELIDAYQERPDAPIVPWHALDVVANALPDIRARFNTFRSFAEASVSDILGARMSSAQELQVNSLDTAVFMNRGGRFEHRPLPIEAQFSPAFGIAVGDLDGDGHEDIFLSQNFFAVEPETVRYDAGLGLLLRGDGTGRFVAVSAPESGIAIHGEQRGCALGDFDADGRVDLAVAQNSAATRLYRNIGAARGLRIRLQGPPLNPSAVGAMVRLMRGTQFGPAREIHAGSGYWSQNSSTVVMRMPVGPDQIWIRWPGGRTSINPVNDSVGEIVLTPP